MDRRLPFFICILAVAGVLIAPPAAAFGGYTVAPAVDVPGQEYHDFDEISFFEESPRMMIIDLALFISPALLLPAEILYSLLVVSCFGLRQVTRQTVLDHKGRRELYELIRDNPGISLSTLRDKTKMNAGTVRYHIELLVHHGMVACRFHRGSRHYYIRNEDYGRMESILLTYLSNENDRTILKLLSGDDVLSHHDLIAAIGTTSPSISWHMKRLVADGIVESYREGRKMMYLLAPDAAVALRTVNREEERGKVRESGSAVG